MERWKSLPLILRQIILGIGIFALGAVLSFGYSYRPLHGSLTFKVDSLEARLDERNREFRRLKDELESLQKDESKRIDPETLSQVESELATTKRVLRDAEKKAKRADSKRNDANTNADRWRKRFEALRDQQQAMPAAVEPSPVAPATAVTSPAELDAPNPAVPSSTPSSTHSPMTDEGALFPREVPPGVPPESGETDLSGSDAFPLP
jgi:hypothetical protein